MTETLYLIDGHAQIFRAYYAIRGGMRSAQTGEPTHAIYGFAGMMLKLFSQLRPDYVVVALDAPGKTFRDDLFADYKATRSATPDDLTAQVPRIRELIECFGIPAIAVPGLEADDIIATICARVLSDPALNHVNIRIVSRDKDLEQLLGKRVSLYDIHTEQLIDCDALYAAKGVRPEQVIDLLTLTGDTVDNVPGVSGIGPKTAAELIQEFGSLENMFASLDQVKGKRREYLEAGRDQAVLSRILVTLKQDGDFDFDMFRARVRTIDCDRVIPLFKELGFNRYQDDVRKLGGAAQKDLFLDFDGPQHAPAPEVPAPVPVPLPNVKRGEYECITTKEALDELAAALRSQTIIAVDTETTGTGRGARLCGLSFAWRDAHGVYVPVLSADPSQHLDATAVLSTLGPILRDESIAKCGHNLKFDARVLIENGCRLRGVVFDSFLASSLVDASQPAHSLDHLAMKLLGYRMTPISDLIGTGDQAKSLDQVELDRVTNYAAEDADIALRLYHALLPQIETMGMGGLLRTAEAPLSAVIAEMEMAGITCDPDELLRQREILAARVDELRSEVLAVVGRQFHLDSPQQLADVLFNELGFKGGKKTKSGFSTDIQELERLAALEDRSNPQSAVPRLLIEYRQLTKLIGTYLGSLRDCVDANTGRIHSTFHQIYTATGRLASQGPNLQNIPVRSDIGRQIRTAFVAAPGHRLICADYSQIELRILAHLSGDAALCDAFMKEQDIHAAVAAQVFNVHLDDVTREQRNQAKTINFGIIYGVTAFGLARRIDGLDVGAATRLIAEYRERFPGINAFLQRCVQEALEFGYVCTILGRRRAIPEIQSDNGRTRSLGERMAINSVVQGSAADLIKLAMVNVQRRIDADSLPLAILLQIHDELVLESPAELAEQHAGVVLEEMERSMSLRVPLRCSAGIGADWFSAK